MESFWRHLEQGRIIPTSSYSDQPYLVKTDDGAWLCAVTTGAGREGAPGQHVISLRSLDQGRTWIGRTDVEPADGPEASYAVLFKTRFGRIYIFYNHNTDNLRQCLADNPPYSSGCCARVDSLGHYVFKYSDDHGRSWSERRYEIPVRCMAIDKANPYQGALRFFWNVGKPFAYRDTLYVPHHKVGRFGLGFFVTSEGAFLACSDIIQEKDPEKLHWQTLPEGECGLRTPPGGGPVAEEQSAVSLSDGSFFTVYRTVDGHPACSYSRDQGRTWETPQYMRFADGRLMKHPRAANFVWPCANGKYLYWFHNHGGCGYEDRNPAWLCAGEETDDPSGSGKRIRWSQPELLLYDDDPYIRISYPDYLEDSGRYYVTETQKDIARVHEIPAGFLDLLWRQFDLNEICRDRLLLEVKPDGPCDPAMPRLPGFTERDPDKADFRGRDLRDGFTWEFWLGGAGSERQAGEIVLIDTRDQQEKGICIRRLPGDRIEYRMSDGRSEAVWVSEPGLLQPRQPNHIAIVVDGGPGIICFVVNGRLCDGGKRPFGWGRFNKRMTDVNGSGRLWLNRTGTSKINILRIYGKALMVSEVIGNFRAGAL